VNVFIFSNYQRWKCIFIYKLYLLHSMLVWGACNAQSANCCMSGLMLPLHKWKVIQGAWWPLVFTCCA
jgi:hypothetical protein